MKIRKLLYIAMLVFGLAALAPTAMGQCESNIPTELNLYSSYCIQVCPWEEYVFFLVCPFEGAQNFPHLVMSPGCLNNGPDCNTQCEPIQPPVWPWRPGQEPDFGGDPHEPGAIFLQNECMQIYVYWNHDGYWVMEILTNNCAGCFCLWFDWQLPVELNGFEAVAGDGEVALTWSTRSESDNDRFEIVRDGAGVVAQIPSMGTGVSTRRYEWVDRNVENGRTYTYRLRTVDMNGRIEDLRSTQATPTFTAPGVVDEFALYQNFPNPFNPTTTIVFDLPEAASVRLDVFNPVGERTATLVNTSLATGRHSVTFDASNLAAGLYFYTIRAGDFTATRKMLLVK